MTPIIETSAIEPRGATAGGLPYPEDTDPVMAGAQAIKALAQATETMIGGVAGGDPLTLYQAFESLAGNPVYPAARWPITYTVDPAQATEDLVIGGDQRGVAFMVRKAATCSAMGYYVTVGATGTLSGFIGANLYYYDGSAAWRFMANSGASKAGAFGNSTGWKTIPWRNAGDTADAPQTLTPGIVYVVSLTMGNWTTTPCNVAAAKAVSGVGNQVNFLEAGGFRRVGRITPRTAITTGDILAAAVTASGNVPLLTLL